MSHEPKLGRWTDAGSDAPPELRVLLDQGRAALGSRVEIEALQASLARALGPAAGLGGASSDAGTLPASGITRGSAARVGRSPSPWLLGGGLVGGLLVGVAAWNALRPAPPLERAAADVTAVAPVSAPPEPELAPPPVSVEPTPPTPEPPAAAAERPVARPKPGARLEQEAALLERARAALATAPARALALTKEHRRRFPRGLLTQEREVIAIEALERLGDERAAGAKASEFDERFRGSVHQERVRESATSEPVAPAPKNSAR
jgi:hypothetical protein